MEVTRKHLDECIEELKKMPEDKRVLISALSIFVCGCILENHEKELDQYKDLFLGLLTEEEKDVLNT